MKDKKRILFFPIVVLIFLAASCSSHVPQQVMTGKSVPYTRLTMLDGTPRIMDEYKGRTVALMFWATWCPRSRWAIERLNKFAASRRNPAAVYVAVSIDKPEDERVLKERIRDLRLSSISHAFSGNETYDEAFLMLSGNQVPYFAVIDPRGAVVYQGDDEDKVFELMSRPRRRR